VPRTCADGYSTDALNRSELLALLRGPSGSATILTISRPGWSHSRAVYMERRPLPQPPLKEVLCRPNQLYHCNHQACHLHGALAAAAAASHRGALLTH
jgi:hypothetical protein